jgi:hypothetical protein
MMFMNEYEIDRARQLFAGHPVLGPATATLSNVRDAANNNSDGWPYWPKPARAAKRLMEMVHRGELAYLRDLPDGATAEELKAAYRPLKAFRTRSGIDFLIVEPS